MELYITNLICILFLAYITLVYFSAKRTPTFQHKLFKLMLFCSIINILSETVDTFCLVTKNQEEVFHIRFDEDIPMRDIKFSYSREILANVTNYVYIITLTFFFYAVFLYVRYLMSGKVCEESKKKEIAMFVPSIVMIVVTIIFTIISNNPLKDMEAWRIGSPLTPLCALFYIFFCIKYMAKYWKNVKKTQRMAVVMAVFAEVIFTVIQARMSLQGSMRVAGLGIVLMDFAFYMTVESPDALLIESLKYEKERADNANNAKSAFLANMSHEIRTPMNAIVGMTEILLRTDLNSQQKSYLYNIKQSGNSLLLIINDLLDFSKIEAGKMELVNENYDPLSVLNDVSMIVLNRIGDKPVELFYEVDKTLPSKLYGDSGRVKQIMINLLNNAIKFTDEGIVKLSINVEERFGKNVTLRFDVEDTGQGIKEEDLEKLFDAFKQVDMARNRKKEGTGLGLSISKQLAKLMGGDIFVESKYGEGSKFSFTIKQRIVNESPVAVIDDEKIDVTKLKITGDMCIHDEANIKRLADDYGIAFEKVEIKHLSEVPSDYIIIDEEAYDVEKETVHELAKTRKVAVIYNPMKNSYVDDFIEFIPRPFYGQRFTRFICNQKEEIDTTNSSEIIMFSAPEAEVLIVDDTDMNLKVAVGLLAPLNMKIDVARSGKEAIHKATKKKYHIIFMDHMMPGMDGIETVKHIRELPDHDGYYKDATIIALTANAAGDAKEAFSKVLVKEFVTKPIEIVQLAAAIKRNLPKEMIKKPISLDELKPKDIAKMIPAIAGLNVAEGIKNSGTQELFENLLGDFYKLIDMKSSKLEKCLEDGMTKDFTIEVHALKNTARMIGAEELSQMFKELEDLGHEERVEEIKKRVPEVMEKYKSYKNVLKPYAEKNDDAKEEVATEVIVELLDDMKDAIENFDIDRADKDMDRLESIKMDEGARPLMDNLRAYIADVAMEDVMKTCDDIKNLITL